MLTALALTGAQINLIIVIAVVFAVLFAGNSVLLALFFRKRKKSKLCTEELQNRREQLLEELHQLQLLSVTQGVTVEELDDEDETVDIDDDEADDEAEDDVDSDEAVDDEPDTAMSFNAEILAVRDMPEAMRIKHGFVDGEYDLKRYYVRPSYSFGAKLARSNYDVRVRYEAVANALNGIAKCKTKRSFRQERASIGRKTVALLLFKGKKLCIALALDPDEYAETKYRGVDVSDKKRFAATPMLIKLTSPRKVDYALYLIERLAQINDSAFDVEFETRYDFTVKSNDELFASGDVKYVILGEAEDLVSEVDEQDDNETPTVRAGILAVNDMSSATRAALNLVGSVYDNKRYFVRYNYSFEAKLRSASDEVKERYAGLLSEAYCYKKLRINETFKGVRLSAGRKTLGQILFKGKTLCIALALNPSVYADTKYRGIDVSSTKRFAATPMLLKLTSARRLSYAKYLMTKLAEDNNLEPNFTGIQVQVDISAMDINQLFNAGLLKISVIGEAPTLKK